MSLEVFGAADVGVGDEHDSTASLEQLAHSIDQSRRSLGGQPGNEHGEGVVVIEEQCTGALAMVSDAGYSRYGGISGGSGGGDEIADGGASRPDTTISILIIRVKPFTGLLLLVGVRGAARVTSRSACIAARLRLGRYVRSV